MKSWMLTVASARPPRAPAATLHFEPGPRAQLTTLGVGLSRSSSELQRPIPPPSIGPQRPGEHEASLRETIGRGLRGRQDRDGTLGVPLGRRVIGPCQRDLGQRDQGTGQMGVLWAQSVLPGLQSPLEVLLGPIPLPLVE